MTAIILVRPQMGENIGTAARVMKNFGLDDLRLVAPRDGWPNRKAQEMSAGGRSVIDAARCYNSVADAVADLNQVLATTARSRDMNKPSHDVREGIASIGSSAGILFGPERTGLENEDLSLADALLHIPVGAEYPSLNIGMAVGVVCYELFVSCELRVASCELPEMATKADMKGMFDQLEAELDARNFWRVPEKKPLMWQHIQTLLMRSTPTDQEVRTLRGIIRCLSERG